MAELPEQIASLLIPMMGRPLLIPNVAVAEIVSWDQPQKQEDTPDWLLGTVDWRGVELPVISLERMNSSEIEDADVGQRLAVINGVGECKLPFYAISVQGLPRLVRVFPEELSSEEVSEDPAYDTLVMVSGERAVIPDLSSVERQLNQVI
ncbi:MAG: chemotaxis protein CheW [Pseudomonadales bacterium]|jgi:chemosensory pili system protein ChpC|uniref:chemotaxis protein CheW n=1 Tax=unclassified Ketobacter TaxID=2639109 RepID=UPI000C8DA378|nr:MULTISPECIES: chemotaxis protein CheW [unclassified Ketobacter]MAA58704.1 chemotaxis protein CheW [Pseudomonadales bacterium]MEC8810206.1 chemotaxis protein CheW [Pseudomonadota bacterium]TNC88944.1 MAG: chemotaxis protein CheW [Alcanivorax sp.]HAG94915.1 chemotaxis protein CheW [Gammaproteobacteria bacterium]MAQ27792.1 chemotaxis protein CheW [Pseudomonadales bacterium]|tara:strand:- start:2500 stop:2949 length:450 start_codon:yes stop_codon:yes gene_type:complete